MECSGDVLCDHSNFEDLYIICAADNQSAGGVCGELHRKSFFRGSDMGMHCEAAGVRQPDRQASPNVTRRYLGLRSNLRKN